MRIPFTLALCAAAACAACAGSQPLPSVDVAASRHSSAAMADIDAQLDALEVETQALETSYGEIQATVLPNTDIGAGDAKPENLRVHVNENNALVVNGSVMTRNDFSLYADRVLPALCSPPPTVTIDTKANYDVAAWALEEIYRRGCANVLVE